REPGHTLSPSCGGVSLQFADASGDQGGARAAHWTIREAGHGKHKPSCKSWSHRPRSASPVQLERTPLLAYAESQKKILLPRPRVVLATCLWPSVRPPPVLHR